MKKNEQMRFGFNYGFGYILGIFVGLVAISTAIGVVKDMVDITCKKEEDNAADESSN